MRTLTLLALLIACDGARLEADLAPPPDNLAQDAVAASAPALRAEAISAYLAKDFATFTDKTQAALNADPDSNVDLYNLACGYALMGDRAAALDALRALHERGVDYGVATDPDFDALRGDGEFDSLVQAFESLYPRVHKSERVANVGERLDIAPEGMAVDPASGTFFVGSMRTGEIWATRVGQPASVFSTLAIDGVSVSAFGLEVDAQRGVLWAIGSGFSLHEAYKPSQQGKTAVFALDLATGDVRGTYVLPGRHPRLGFNDMAVGSDGTLYLSGGDLYVLRPGASAPEVFGLQPALGSSNGIALGPDGTTLYVAADREGIARVDLQRKTWSWLDAPDGTDMRSFSGLYWAGDGMVGIQLGLARWRAVQLDLSEDGARVETMKVLEQGNPDIAYATSGDVYDGAFYFLARAPLPPGTDRSSVGPAGGMASVWRAPLAAN
ncbi:MAG: SMP-30/gluconolactonase/LRE family protein [Myxococcota bacterium]